MSFKSAQTLMVQGTTSDAGKSVLVSGLCRVLARRGVSVAPFKPQNMALNSAVTTDGGEIGRAQAVQAQACYLEPHTDMNPILLKPSSDVGAQVIIHGKALTNMNAVDYHDYKQTAKTAVLQSHERLIEQYQALVVEGAGSPAEINLRENDVANMGFAEAVDCPVIIVADIDRGGVFAHLVGTLDLLSESEQQRVTGFVINRFRGDIALLQSGLDWLEQRTGKPVLGVLPYLHGFHLEAEDAIVTAQSDADEHQLKVVVPVFSRISNHTDFDALRLHPQVDLQYVGAEQAIPAADLIILPGSKNTRRDLQWLRDNGWCDALQKHLRYGGKVIGICGGFQMLGQRIDDPQGLEGTAGSSEGLGYLAMTTELQPHKQLQRVSGELSLPDQAVVPVQGYEIHMGVSQGTALQHSIHSLIETSDTAIDPVHSNVRRSEGALSDDGLVLGTYLHGLFDHAEACRELLHWAGLRDVKTLDYRQRQDAEIERLADTLEQHMDLQRTFAHMPVGVRQLLNETPRVAADDH